MEKTGLAGFRFFAFLQNIATEKKKSKSLNKIKFVILDHNGELKLAPS